MLRLNKMRLGPRKQAALKVQSGALTFWSLLSKVPHRKKGESGFFNNVFQPESKTIAVYNIYFDLKP